MDHQISPIESIFLAPLAFVRPREGEEGETVCDRGGNGAGNI